MYQYELYIYNSDLQKFLWKINNNPSHHININTIQILKRYTKQNKILNLINFHINLKIDQLCIDYELQLNQFNYIPFNSCNNRNKFNLIKKQINGKKWGFHRKLKKNQKLFIVNLIKTKQIFNSLNLIDLINCDKAFNDSDISALIDSIYYRHIKLLINGDCLNLLYLLDFILDANVIGIDDLEEILIRFGQKVKTFVGNLDLLCFKNFEIDDRIKLLLYLVSKHCPCIKRIVLNGINHKPMIFTTVDNSPKIPTSEGESYSAYYAKKQVDIFLKVLHERDIIFLIKKISNVKLNCDKSVKKILQVQLFSSTLLFLQKVKSLPQVPKLNFQSAFRWHNEHYFKWKKLPISNKLKSELIYFVTQTNLKKYLNINDLMSTNEAFYDINNFDFLLANYQISYVEKFILTENKEFKLYEYLNTLNRDYITIYQFINLLKIFGNSIKIFNGSEYLITVPRYTQFKLEKIYYFIRMYCKNLTAIIMNGHLINKIKNLNNNNKLIINDGNDKDVMALISMESKIEEINIKDYRNIMIDNFINLIKLPYLKELFINSNYNHLTDWNFLTSKSYNLKDLSLQAIFEIYLYNDSIDNNPIEQNDASELFIRKFLEFLHNYNRNQYVKLGFYLYDCYVNNYELFSDVKINWVGFSNMAMTQKNLIDLGKCRNLYRIEFLNCDKLTNDYLFMLCRTIIETNRFNEKVDVIISNCFITNEFIYSYAAYHLRRTSKRKTFNFWQHPNIKFKFNYCSITVDWENVDFQLSETGDYIDIIDKTTKSRCKEAPNEKPESDYSLYIS